MRKFRTMEFKGKTLDFYVGEYSTGGKVYVKATHQRQDYCDITINLPDIALLHGFAHVSTDVPTDLLQAMYDNNVCERCGEVQYNFGTYPLVVFPDLV